MSAYTAIIQVHVKPECVDAFRAATLVNAKASRLEPGILRFELLQQTDAPDRFVLVEEYRNPEAQLSHRETPHYAVWRDTVAPMMASPRSPLKYLRIEPV
jgi:hypothetical protein